MCLPSGMHWPSTNLKPLQHFFLWKCWHLSKLIWIHAAYPTSSLPFPSLETCPFYFLIIYSTQIQMTFSLRSQEMITSMFQPDLDGSRNTFFQMEHEKPFEKMWRKNKTLQFWYVKTIKQTSWVDFQELCLTQSMRELEQNKSACDSAGVLQPKDFPCTTSKCGHQSSNLYDKGHTVSRPRTNRIQVKQSLFPTLQQRNLVASTVHCIYRLFNHLAGLIYE